MQISSELEQENRLLRERIAKMERTIAVYDMCLNTPSIDVMRKRIFSLEKAVTLLLASAVPLDQRRPKSGHIIPVLSDRQKDQLRAVLANKIAGLY